MCWLSWIYHYLAFYWMHDFSNELDVMLDSTQKSQSHFAARLKQRLVDEWVEEESNTSSVHLHALNFQTTARTKQALHGGSRYTVSIVNWSRMYVVILLLLLLLCAIMLCAIICMQCVGLILLFSVSLFLAFFSHSGTQLTRLNRLTDKIFDREISEEHDKIRKWEALLI